MDHIDIIYLFYNEKFVLFFIYIIFNIRYSQRNSINSNLNLVTLTKGETLLTKIFFFQKRSDYIHPTITFDDCYLEAHTA